MAGRLAVDGGTPIRNDMLSYGRHSIDQRDIDAVVEVLQSDWLTTGPKVDEFEDCITGLVESVGSVAVSSGTAALHVGMAALGVSSGDEVVVPALTFAATANCVVYQGATPVFVDVLPGTLLVDPEANGVSKTVMESVANYPQYLVEFDDVPLAEDAVLGEIAEGRAALDLAVQRSIVIQCAETLGRAQKVLEMVVEYAGHRVAFGRPIGTFQAVQHRCADLRVAVDGGRMLTYQAAWKLDEGIPANEEVSMAKAQAGMLSRLATEAGHSIFAGISFTVEHDMQLYSARAKIAEANLGDTEYHLDQLAAGMQP